VTGARPDGDTAGVELDPAVAQWAERAAPGARVTGWTVRPLAGGAVARWVERLTLHLSGGHGPVELVRKQAAALEIAGLRAAQAVRGQAMRTPATAIPELVACGDDWLVMPFAVGVPLDWGDPVPANLFGTLAMLHARYQGGAGLPAAIPRVTPAWWQELCRDWVDPRLPEHSGRHPAAVIARARALIGRAAGLPAASGVLAALPPTLLHGDVHPGNVLVDPVPAGPGAGLATLIDWGSSRVGPAALDLANLVAADSAEVARYAGAWQQVTGQPLPGDAIELGYRWAALQIPVQYLPWMAGHRSTSDVEAALDRIEQALGRLLLNDRNSAQRRGR
jgi:Phosphotransferase enzyme family